MTQFHGIETQGQAPAEQKARVARSEHKGAEGPDRSANGAVSDNAVPELRHVCALEFRVANTTMAIICVPSSDSERMQCLTPAEQDIVRRILLGESNRQIAKERGASTKTVANQIHAIFDKLGADSRAQLAALIVPRWGRRDLAHKPGTR